MTFWGWIPSLDRENVAYPIPDDIRRYPMPMFKVTDADDKGCKVMLKDGTSIDVAISDNIISFDMNKRSKPLAQNICREVLGVYHVHVTHRGIGLECVSADSREEALPLLARGFLKWMKAEEWERANGQMPTTDDLMNRLGMIEYGLAFVDRYWDELPNEIRYPIKETLVSQKTFMDSRITHQSSENVEIMSEKMNDMTVAVLCLTWLSAVIAVLGYLWSSSLLRGTTAAIAGVVLSVLPMVALVLIPRLRSLWARIRNRLWRYRSRAYAKKVSLNEGRSRPPTAP